jgi:hypothetical protein
MIPEDWRYGGTTGLDNATKLQKNHFMQNWREGNATAR